MFVLPVQLWAEPIMFTLPFFCLVLDVCPYGMDSKLYWTHIAHLIGQFCYSVYHREWERVVISMQVRPPPHPHSLMLASLLN